MPLPSLLSNRACFVLLPLLLLLPWLGVGLFVLVRVRLPRPLPDLSGDPEGSADRPTVSVSVIIPARDEAHNIQRVLTSVCASDYPDFEVVVVDDRSTDGTAALARAVAPNRARRLQVLDGKLLPDGWLGKPWACRQGAQEARGDLLLFTDADTIHAPTLLARAVRALQDGGADAVTLAGRQLMESFWERLVQPQLFLSMLFRFPDQSRPVSRDRWRDAIANGQYILFRREVYQELGGHEAVRAAVVEDLRLAQLLVRSGRVLEVRGAEEHFATHMYRNLGELVRGWSKNVVLGGLQTLPPHLRPFIPPVMLLAGTLFWLVPPVGLAAAFLGLGGSWLLLWAGTATGFSALFWAAVTWRFGAPFYYGLLYPLGAAVAQYIILRSWMGMGNVEWKGRRYEAVMPAD